MRIGFEFDSDSEAVDLGLVHTGDGAVCLFSRGIVDDGIVFEVPEAARVDASKVGKNFVDVVLSNVGTEVFHDDSYEFDAVFRRF